MCIFLLSRTFFFTKFCPSATHFRVVVGPFGGFKNGDVEILFNTPFKWESVGGGRVSKPDDVTLLHCQRDVLSINLFMPSFCFYICAVHLPHTWNRPDESTIDNVIEFQRVYLLHLDAVLSKRVWLRPVFCFL